VRSKLTKAVHVVMPFVLGALTLMVALVPGAVIHEW
jgi:hypothetical protein